MLHCPREVRLTWFQSWLFFFSISILTGIEQAIECFWASVSLSVKLGKDTYPGMLWGLSQMIHVQSTQWGRCWHIEVLQFRKVYRVIPYFRMGSHQMLILLPAFTVYERNQTRVGNPGTLEWMLGTCVLILSLPLAVGSWAKVMTSLCAVPSSERNDKVSAIMFQDYLKSLDWYFPKLYSREYQSCRFSRSSMRKDSVVK